MTSASSSAASAAAVTNVNRVTGLGTGLDIESIISQTMKAKSAPLDKLKQQEQLLLWKQDAYREQNTSLTSLRDLLTDLRYETTYNTRVATSSNSQAVTATANPNTPIGTYNINVSQLATAAINSSSTSLTIGASITSNYLMEATFGPNHDSFSITLDGVTKTITIPPSAYGTYKPGDTSGKSLDDLASVIQTQLNNAGFDTPVSVKTTTDQELVFYTGKSANGTNHTLVMNDIVDNSADTSGTANGFTANTLTLGDDAGTSDDFYAGMTIKITNSDGTVQTRTITKYDAATKTITVDKDWDTDPDANAGYEITNGSTLASLGLHDRETSKALVGKILTDDPSATITVDSNNRKFKIAVGNGSYQEVTLDTGNYTLPELAQQIESKIRALKTTDPNLDNVRVSVTNYNQLSIETVASDNKPLSVKLGSASTLDFLQEMGFSDGAASDSGQTPLNTTTSLYSQKDRFMNSDFFDTHINSSSPFSFSINGQSFTFNATNTLDDIIKAINSNTAAGVTAFYDSFKDKLVLTSNKSGDLNPNGPDIQLTDPDNFLSQVLNISSANEVSGKNAIVSINGYETQQQGNNFTVNGTTFTINGTGSATVAVATDTSGITDKIQKFIDSYNTLIAAMNTKVNESRATAPNDKYTYYLPLTDDQRAAMSDDQIKQWEDKAKQGLLQNDNILESCLQTLRMNLAGTVSTTTSLAGIPLSGTINLNGANRFTVTYGNQTREIQLDIRSYSSSEYGSLVGDMQQKLDAAFGKGSIKVALNSNNQLSLTTNNTKITLNNGSSSSGLNQLGFSDGATLQTTVNTLAQIGITTATGADAYTENGKLYLDKDKLAAALQQDPEGVIRLLTNNGANPDGTTNPATEGIFHKLYGSVGNSMDRIKDQAGTSGTASTTTVIGRQLTDLSKQIETTQDRLDAEENRLYTMYNNMDTMIGQMNAQLTALQNMFGTNSSQ